MALLRHQKTQEENWASFQTIERVLQEIVTKCLENKRLQRLLYYTDKHALGLPELTQEQAYSLIGTSIKIVPKVGIDPDVKPYVVISFDRFEPNPGQTTFRQMTLTVDIVCNYDHWILDDYKLRPYAIAGEIDGMINNSFTKVGGVADFTGAKQLILNEHLGGCTLYYNVEAFFDDTAPQTYKS